MGLRASPAQRTSTSDQLAQLQRSLLVVREVLGSEQMFPESTEVRDASSVVGEELPALSIAKADGPVPKIVAHPKKEVDLAERSCSRTVSNRSTTLLPHDQRPSPAVWCAVSECAEHAQTDRSLKPALNERERGIQRVGICPAQVRGFVLERGRLPSGSPVRVEAPGKDILLTHRNDDLDRLIRHGWIEADELARGVVRRSGDGQRPSHRGRWKQRPCPGRRAPSPRAAHSPG